MRRYHVYALILAFILLLGGCAPAAPSTPPASIAPPADTPAATEAPADTPEPTQAPQQEEPAASDADVEAIRQDLEAMLPIMDSILRAMGTEVEFPYEPRDEEFFWTVLYLMGNNFGATHPLVTLDEESTVIPRLVMQEFASAAFLDYDDLLPIPEDMEANVWYDEGYDAYRVAFSDKGDTMTLLGESVTIRDGGNEVVVTVELHGAADGLLGALSFVLAPNPYADAISDPVYLYSVKSVGGV